MRRRLALLALAVGAPLVTLLAAELVVRTVLPQDLAFFDGSAIKRVSARPGLRYELIPGGSAPGYVGVPVSVNRLGLRDREVTVPKPPGVVRVLGLGDSVTFGYGVDLGETYLKILEARLNTGARAGVRYETVNAGVEESGLEGYRQTLERLAPVLEPDLVLVGLVLNDIQRYDDPVERPTLAGPAPGPGPVRRLHGALLRRSHVYLASALGARSLLYGLGVLDIAEVYGSPLRAVGSGGESLERAWASSLAALDRLAGIAHSRAIPLVLVVFPVEVQLDAAALARYRADFGVTLPPHALDGEPQRRLVAFGEARGVPVVDLLPAFRAAAGADLYLRRGPIRFDPVHPSPRGHRIAAEAIHRQLTGVTVSGRSVLAAK